MSAGDQSSTPSKASQFAGQVIALLETDLKQAGYELLDVRIFQGGGRFQVRVYVDLPDGGINMDQCTKAARSVSMLLEEADLFPGQYVIEVSSPGIRRPLRTLDHFQAACGEKVDIKLKPGEGPNRWRGELLEAAQDGLVIAPVKGNKDEEEPAPVTVALEQVAEANLDPEFDAQAIINADRRRRKEDRQQKRRERAGKKRKGRPKAGKKPTSESSDTGSEK